MARTHEEMMAALSAEDRVEVERYSREMITEINGLQAVRKLAGISQVQLADQLGLKQPSIHKMEKQADFYVSTLERFVEAAGGTVSIVVDLPGHAPVKLKRFADLQS